MGFLSRVAQQTIQAMELAPALFQSDRRDGAATGPRVLPAAVRVRYTSEENVLWISDTHAVT